MDINKYLAENNVVVKKEVNDPREVPICPPSVAKDFSLSKVENSKETLKTTQLLLLANEPVSYDILQSPSTLPVNAIIPSFQSDMPQGDSTLPIDTMQLPPLERTLHNAATLPTVNKVVKPKKRAKKRYVFSKPKKRSKKKLELPTLPLLETYNTLSANENNGEGIDSDGSSDTTIVVDGDDHATTTSTEESFSAGEMTRPLELGRLLIRKGVVKMLPHSSRAVQDSVNSTSKPLPTLPVFESTPIKKELYATDVADIKQSGIDMPNETSIGNLQREKIVELSVSQDFSHLPLYNDIGLKKSGKKQTARRGRGKPSSARNSKKNTANFTQSSLENEGTTFDNASNLPTDQLETTVHDTSLNSTVSETVIKAKPKRKKTAAKRKPKNVDASMHTDIETAKLLNSTTVGGELLNTALYETVEKPKRKRAATPRKSKKKIFTAALPTELRTTEFLDATAIDETLLNAALHEAPKKPARKRTATPRKSPKKNNSEMADSVDNPNLLEIVGTPKPKRKRAPPKKGVQRKKTNSILEAALLDKSEVVESCLVLSVKKELDNAAHFDSSFPDCNTDHSTFRSANISDVSNLTGTTIVSLSFEEDVSKKEDNEDNASLLLAFKQRNAKGQFTRSPKSSNIPISVCEEKSRELSSNLPAKTCLPNEPEPNENLRMIKKPLPLRYLSNFESAPSSTNSVIISSSAKTVSEDLKSKSVDGLSSNLNIKKEPADIFKCESTIINSTTAQLSNESQTPEQHLCNQPIIPISDFAVADFTSVPPTKRKQTARRGRRGMPTRQQSSRISNEPLNDQSVPIAPDASVADFSCMPSTLNQKKKQTARRGRRGTLTSQQPLQTSKEPSSDQSTLLSDNSILDPQTAPFAVSTQRKQTARRGKNKTPGAQMHSREAPLNLLERHNDFSPPSQITPNLIPSTTSNSATTSFQISNTIALSKVPSTHLSNITIKDEPKDPEYEVITLDDSPIKKNSKQNVESAFPFNSQVALPQVSSINTDILVKKEFITDQNENLAISDHHLSTSKPISVPTENIQSNSINTASSATLSSISEAIKLTNVSDKILPSIPPLIDSSKNNNLESSTTQMSTEPLSKDIITLTTTFPSFIKREVQDSSELQKNISFPNESPSFFKCLNPINLTNESQSVVHQFPVTVGSIPTEFPTAENPVNSSLSTQREVQSVLKSCTDAVYSNMLSEEIRLDESKNSHQQISRDFQPSPHFQFASKEQSHEAALSTVDTTNFANDVSIESLKNIIGFSDFTSGMGIKETSNSTSVYSNMDKDSTFRLDDDDTSSRTSSFLSRSSPRLSTPHSDCASHRLTDSVSPLTKIPEHSGKTFVKDACFNEVRAAMEVDLEQSVPEGESDGLTIKNVGLKLRYAASLAQNSISDLGDKIPLDNYPVVDGEVECFHKLLLAAFVPKLNHEDHKPPLEESVPKIVEEILSEETSVTPHLPIPDVEVNRSSLLDQFISQKIAEENSLSENQRDLFYRRTPQREQISSFHTNEPHKSYIIHPKDTLPKNDFGADAYSPNRSEATKYAVLSDPCISYINEDAFKHGTRLEYYASRRGETSKNATETYVPLPPGEMTYKNERRLDSYEPLSCQLPSSHNTLPFSDENKKTAFDLSFIPNMLKLISNLRESSSKNIASSKMPSTQKSSNLETSNKQVEENFTRKMGRSSKGTTFDMEDSKLHSISTLTSTHVSNPFAETSESALQQDIVEISNYSSQNNTDKYLDNQDYSLSSNTLKNFSFPSKELLFNVIKNTQQTSTNDPSCSLANKEPSSSHNRDLINTSVQSRAVQLSQGVAVFNSDLHSELSNCEVMSCKIDPKSNIVNTEESEVSSVEIINNVPNSKHMQINEVEVNLTEKISNLFPKTAAFVSKEKETQVNEELTVEPVKANPIVDKIDVAELLKILSTAKNLQSDNAVPNLNLQCNETYNHEPSTLQNSGHLNIGYGNASSTDNRYSYPENYREQYSNYAGSDSMQLKMPIIHEYDHKPRTDSYNQGSVLGASQGANKDISISNADTRSKDSIASDSDADNDFLNNETELVDDSACEETDERIKPNENKEVDPKDEEPHDFPQYKSRWERIMERKNQANDRAKLNEHLLEDYYSVKVPKSKPKIQKPIAHVQPCSQKSPKKKIIKKKVASEQPSLPLKKKKGNQTEIISRSALKNKKTKNAEVVPSSAPPLKKKKSNNGGVSINTKVGDTESITIKKKKVANAEVPSASGLPLKKIKGNNTEVTSPKSKKSKEGKGIIKKQNVVKLKKVTSEVSSDLFAPDKVVVKRKDVKHSGVKKVDDEASKRLFGRVTNRGSFLTESSVTQPPKPKAHLGRMGSDKIKGSRIFADELHSMVATPEIRIGPENEFLQKQSKKLSLEAYKMKKNIFNDPNIGAMSPRVDFFSATSSNRQIQTSYNVFNDLSPDISYQASSDSSDFLSPPDPFASNISVLPHLDGVKSHFSRNAFSTPVNISPVVKPFPFTRRTLLPDPEPSFKEGTFSNDLGREAQSSHIMSPLFTNPSNTFFSSSHNLTPVTNLIPQPVPPVSNFSPQPIPPVSNLVPQPVPPVISTPITPVASFPSRNHHRLPRSRQTRCVCLPPKTLKASVGQAVFETFDVLLLILEWNVDWLVQQQKCLDPPPICNAVKKVVNKYEDLEDYYNTYLPLLLLETWQRIYASWTHLHQASPYFCEITSYAVETHTIKVECTAVFRSSDAEKGLVPEKGNIIMIKFGTKEKGGIKILGYVRSVKVTAFDPVSDPQNTCYRTLKYTATEVLQRLTLTFVGAYNSEDFDKDLLIRIQVLCNIKSILKQNDAMLNIKNSPLFTNILNPLNDGLRIANVITKHANPLKVSETVNDCVRDIVKGILSPHPLPLLTIAKSLPSSDRLLVLLPLIEKMKHSYKTKVLLCTRTTKALNDIGFHLEGGAIKVVIIGNRADIHQKLKKYFLDDLAIDKANSSLGKQTYEIPGFQKSANKDAIESAKIDILKECDVILSNIRNCHNDFIAKACADGDCIPQMCGIVDEANLCTEPEILIPLLYGISKLILIGDPDVLAKVCSKTAISYGYNRSVFHRANELDLASE